MIRGMTWVGGNNGSPGVTTANALGVGYVIKHIIVERALQVGGARCGFLMPAGDPHNGAGRL